MLHVDWQWNIALGAQGLDLVDRLLPALAVTQCDRAVALQAQQQAGIRRRGVAGFGQQGIEACQRRIDVIEAPCGIGRPRRHLHCPTQAPSGQAAACAEICPRSKDLGRRNRSAKISQHIGQRQCDLGVVRLQLVGLAYCGQCGVAVPRLQG